jgi:Uma2 family endonuclease
MRSPTAPTHRSINGAPWGEVDALVRVPADAHALAGFRTWALSDDFPEKLRVSFFNGEVYLHMSKEEIQTHSLVKTEVGGVLWKLNSEIDFGELFINCVLLTNPKADISTNPDMVAVRWESLQAGRVQYVTVDERELEIVGSPDWILEIVSDSSVVKDNETLREAYHRAGAREYWIIDARGREIEFQVLVRRKGGYSVVRSRDGWLASRVFGRSFRLTRRRNRRAAWKYQLAVRST